MQFTIIGAGGIGGLQGAWMARAGVDVVLVDKWVEHVEAINQFGLESRGSRGDHRIPVRAITPDRLGELAPLQAVIVVVKSQHTQETLEQILPFADENTYFVSMQAGMNPPVFESVVGSERTIAAVPNYGGALADPGFIETGFPNYIHIGEMDGRFTPRLRQLQQALNNFTPTQMTDNIMGHVWSKHVFNSQVIASALVDAPFGTAFSELEYRRLVGTLVRESIGVADALGIDLVPFDFSDPEPYRVVGAEDTEGLLFFMEKTMARREVFRRFGNHQYIKTASGMWWDIFYRKRPSEGGPMLRALLSDADKAKVPVPLNRRLLQMIEELEGGIRAAGLHNLEELRTLAEENELILPLAE